MGGSPEPCFAMPGDRIVEGLCRIVEGLYGIVEGLYRVVGGLCRADFVASALLAVE